MGHNELGFSAILDAYNRGETSLSDAESEMRRRYARTGAVVVLDMSQFSFSVRSGGIVNFMAKIRRMHGIVEKQINAFIGGELVKFEADNAFLFFPGDADQALQLAADWACAVRQEAKDNEIAVSIGIAHGEVLFANETGVWAIRDYFGDAVNIASKLGEDIAQGGQILIANTDESLFQDRKVEKRDFSISGLSLSALEIMEESCDHRKMSVSGEMDVAGRVHALIAEQLGVTELYVASNPGLRFSEELDCDSLDLVEFAISLDTEFDIEVDETNLLSIKTVGEMVLFVEKLVLSWRLTGAFLAERQTGEAACR